jgi:N-formylglutamate amidohydrolase
MPVRSMRYELPGILVLDDAASDPAPVVLDSPHSGGIYPPEFQHSCPIEALRPTEDSHVDRLFEAAPGHGAALLAGLFPRAFIDPNRAEDDIDVQMFDRPWPGQAHPSDKARVGMGLIRRVCRPGMPMYDRKLRPDEVRARIERYYRPYHAALADLIERRYATFGAVWYMNCHSMPSTGAFGAGAMWDRADFVLGDRDGTACEPGYLRLVERVLTGFGYSVRINDPYKGVELVRRWGKPRQGLHALQIEVNRRLYMNEITLVPNGRFETLQSEMGQLVEAIAAYARDQLTAIAAD